MDRFYIDGRGGCVAVRDRLKVNEEDQGLRSAMLCVIAYWVGHKSTDSEGNVIWETYDWQLKKAHDLVELLNKSQWVQDSLADTNTKLT